MKQEGPTGDRRESPTFKRGEEDKDDQWWRSKVACPGDPDLDLDLHGLTINAVVSTDHEIIVSFINGSGWWIISGERHHVLKVTEMTISLDVRSAETIHTIPAFVATFERWRDAMTELRVCAAPGRLTAVISAPDDWVPVPRRWPPPCDTGN